MAYLKVKRPWTAQPERLVELDQNHWAFEDIVFAFSAGRGFYDGKHPGLPGTLTTFTTIKPGAGGKYLENTVPGNNAYFSNNTDHDTLAGVTLIGLVQPSSVSGQMTVVSKDAGGGGTNTPLGLLLDAGAVSLNRANAGFRVWKGVATLAAGQLAVVAATQGANIGTAPKFYINGQFDTGSAVNLFGGSGTGAPIATTQGIKVSANTSFGNRFLGGIYDAIVINQEYNAGQVAELSRHIWSIWKPRERKIYFTASASSDGVGSADGSATVSGVGSSTAESVASSSGSGTASGVGQAVIESVGSASGVATVSGVGTSGTGSSGSAAGSASVAGVGAAITASVGSSDGLALASGVGASVATSTGTASGTSTVSGVGDSIQAGSAVGAASGASAVSGASASVVAAVGNASGDCSVYGVGARTGGEVESFSGGYPYISRESHAERKKKQRIALGIIEEEKPEEVPALEQFEISELTDKTPVLVPAKKQHIPARQQKKLDQEAINAELKALIQLELDREEEAIIRMLMEL